LVGAAGNSFDIARPSRAVDTYEEWGQIGTMLVDQHPLGKVQKSSGRGLFLSFSGFLGPKE
jgi:hypothetical protein